MLTISANLGFLWTDLLLPDAIRAAAAAGFDAVECHMPYDVPATDVKGALDDTGLRMLSLNTRIGDQPEDLGVAAVPGRDSEAREYIDEAIEYAAAIDCSAISVVAGKTGRTNEAEATYQANLAYGANRAEPLKIDVFIEPLNTQMCSDYHLVSADSGAATISDVGAANLKLMIDYYHLCVMEKERRPVLERNMAVMGHFQFASIPDRNEPNLGNVDYQQLLPWLASAGYEGGFGAEYTPATTVEAGLGWLKEFRKGTT